MNQPNQDHRLILQQVRPLPDGLGYRFSTTLDNLPVLTADKIIRGADDGLLRRKIGLSLSSGCEVGCIYCFTRDYVDFRPLSAAEIVEQATIALSHHPLLSPIDELKFSFKQMGDPLLNPTNTLAAIRRLHRQFPDSSFVVSTSGVRQNLWFFSELQDLQSAGINIRLQFSCHTTSDKERRRLSPRKPMLTLAEIAVLANNWHGNQTTLNFVLMDGFKHNPTTIARLFHPDKVFIKINYLDHNRQTRELDLRDLAPPLVQSFVDRLENQGFQWAYRHKP